MKLVWKLLRQHINVAQLTGFFVANLIGMTIFLIGVQFYNDIKAFYESEDSLMKDNYLIINKRIGSLSLITDSDNSFTNFDIEDLKSQPFVKKIGLFTPSAFKVSAGFNLHNSMNFSTDMFFESVPDEFVDVDKSSWVFNEDADILPIVIPKSYIDLYNFGFAQSQNLPPLSEGVLQAINIDVKIRNIDDEAYYKGNIVGFSNRLNTILVPEKFIKFANNKFASDRTVNVSRIIIQVDNPTDDKITSYLQDNNYETDEDKLDASKTNFILNVLVTIVVVIGVIICLLALFILILSIYLLVEKNMSKLENLILIGYSVKKVALPYQLLTLLLNFFISIISVVVVFFIRNIYLTLFQNFFPNMDTPSFMSTIFMALIVNLILSSINYFTIRHKILSIWNICK